MERWFSGDERDVGHDSSVGRITGCCSSYWSSCPALIALLRWRKTPHLRLEDEYHIRKVHGVSMYDCIDD